MEGARTQRNFLKVFDQVCKTLKSDYVDNALFRYSSYGTFQGSLETLNPAMFQNPRFCDATLAQIILDFLGWFDDPGLELRIGSGSLWQPGSLGFSTMRYNDSLYVTEVVEEERLQRGERIVGLNGMTLNEAFEQVERTLRGGGQEQREDWSIALQFAKTIQVERADGTKTTLDVRQYASTYTPKNDVVLDVREDVLPGHLGVLRISRADVPEYDCAINALRAHAAMLDALVIDTRGAVGGARSEAAKLIPFIIDSETDHHTVFGDAGLFVNCSRRNVDERVSQLECLREQCGSGEASILEGLISDLQEARAAGFCIELAEETNAERFEPVGTFPVVILVDRFTSGAMEQLVRACGTSERAVAIGRATAGSLDNTLPHLVKLDEDFSLVVPTAKYLAANELGVTKGVGITPNIIVTWEPSFIDSDRDMAAAIALLRDH